MRRRRRRKTHWSIWLLLIGLLAIAVVTLFLIHRGAKVQGPDDSSAGTTSVIDTTPTSSSGTYAASGKANDPDGEALTVKVYLTLQSKQRFVRELKITGSSVRMIVDSGTYTKAGSHITMHSTQAVVFQYASQDRMAARIPSRKSRYGASHSAYPDYLTAVLNNQLTTSAGKPSHYHYVDTSLKLTVSGAVVPTVSEAIDEQAAVETSTSHSSHAVFDTTASSAAQSSDSSSDSSSAQSSSASASSHLSVEQAQALIDAQYPPSDYTSTAMGEQNGTFSFVVINRTTHENQTVTVTPDGTVE